jgi:uncharacterized membrane protein YphA (DoxX/SURF4 family)
MASSEKWQSALAWALRVGLGLWFIYSGVNQVFFIGLDKFTQSVANYKLVDAPLDAVAAYSVPWVEIVMGLCLLTGLFRRGTLLVFGGLVTVFAIAIGWAWKHELQIACGCHGGDEPIQYWGKVAEFAGYYLAIAYLWRQDLGASCGDPGGFRRVVRDGPSHSQANGSK